MCVVVAWMSVCGLLTPLMGCSRGIRVRFRNNTGSVVQVQDYYQTRRHEIICTLAPGATRTFGCLRSKVGYYEFRFLENGGRITSTIHVPASQVDWRKWEDIWDIHIGKP